MFLLLVHRRYAGPVYGLCLAEDQFDDSAEYLVDDSDERGQNERRDDHHSRRVFELGARWPGDLLHLNLGFGEIRF